MPLLLLFMGLLSKLNLESLLCQLCHTQHWIHDVCYHELNNLSLAATLTKSSSWLLTCGSFRIAFRQFAFCSRSTTEACEAHWALSALVRSAARCDVFAKGEHCFLNRPLLHMELNLLW